MTAARQKYWVTTLSVYVGWMTAFIESSLPLRPPDTDDLQTIADAVSLHLANINVNESTSPDEIHRLL